MNFFGTKLVLLVAAVAVAATSAAAAESVNASSVVNELEEQLRAERAEHQAEREQLQVERAEHRAELKQLQDELAMCDNVKVGGGGSGSSFFADVVVERQHYKNKKSSFSASSSLLVVPSSQQQQQQQQRRLKSDKKNPPQPPPMLDETPDPPTRNPNTIDPMCYPEHTMQEFDFFIGDDTLPMALSPWGEGNGDSTGYMHWPFNRGMSAITVGGAYSGGGGNPPTVITILGTGENNGINIAAAQYSETDSAGQSSYQYHAQQLTDQVTSLGTVTAVTFIPPYIYNTQYESWQPDTANLDTIYFLVGVANGYVNMCSIRPGYIPGKMNLTPTCEDLGYFGYQGSLIGNISEMLYIPQIKAVVIMTFAGGFYSYSLTFDSDKKPTLATASSNIDYLNGNICGSCNYCTDCNSPPSMLPRSLAAVYVDDDTTYLYAAGLYPTDCYKGGVGNGAPIEIFNINGSDAASLPITHVGTIENTYLTYQIVPAPTGIYFAAGGAGVFYIPYQGQDAKYGMLGSATPTIYQAYGVPDDSKDEPQVTVTSITYSANPNNVVVYVDPGTAGNISYAFQGGALFISFVTSCDLSDQQQVSDCSPNQGYLDSGCIGSILTRDTCTGVNSLFVDNSVLGPVYTSIVDVNMNLFVQNGEGGLSIFSLAYTPGFASDIEWIMNTYYTDSCTCTPPPTLMAEILAGVALVLAIVAIPELLPEAAGAVVVYAGIASATAGVAVTFAPLANDAPSYDDDDYDGSSDYIYRYRMLNE